MHKSNLSTFSLIIKGHFNFPSLPAARSISVSSYLGFCKNISIGKSVLLNEGDGD